MPLTENQWKSICGQSVANPMYQKCSCGQTLLRPEFYQEKLNLGHVMDIVFIPTADNSRQIRLIAVGCANCGAVKFIPAGLYGL